MKKYLLLMLMFPALMYAQIGIKTHTPRTTLDVEGNLRIAKVESGTDDVDLLTISNQGVVNKIELKSVLTKKKVMTIVVASGETLAINVGEGFANSNINLQSKNTCTRNMIASFISSDGSIAFLGGIARDVLGIASIETIGGGTSVFSPAVSVVFPYTTSCADGGDGSQFNFTLKKLSNTVFNVTNNGNITRTYIFTITAF